MLDPRNVVEGRVREMELTQTTPGQTAGPKSTPTPQSGHLWVQSCPSQGGGRDQLTQINADGPAVWVLLTAGHWPRQGPWSSPSIARCLLQADVTGQPHPHPPSGGGRLTKEQRPPVTHPTQVITPSAHHRRHHHHVPPFQGSSRAFLPCWAKRTGFVAGQRLAAEGR